MKKFLVLAVLAISAAAYADNPPPAAQQCVVVREAQARISVNKISYSQVNGVWVPYSVPVAFTSTTVQVYGDDMTGCKLNFLTVENVMLNGKPEIVNVSAWIKVLTTPTTPVKRFSANYWISSENGKAGWAATETEDLKLEKARLLFETESSQTTTVHDDMLSIVVTYDDAAQ